MSDLVEPPSGPVTVAGTADRAPIAPGALEPALRPFGHCTMLPAVAYTSDDVFAWERRHLFAGSWTCVGRVEELRDGGVTQRGLVVGDVPVLLTFPPDRGVRALANTCRHRGHEILPTGGTDTRQALLCPYHAWRYSLSGSLLGAPGFRDVDGFSPSEHGLVRLPAEVWHGLLFVDASAGAAPFTDHVGALDSLVAPYRPSSLVRLARHDYEVAANWKVIAENYHECYHCPLIHPELCRVAPPDSGANYDLPGSWVGGSMDLRDGMATMSLTGELAAPPLPGVDPARVEYLHLMPNLLVSAHPDYVM